MTHGSKILIGMVSGLSLITLAAVSTPAHDRAPDSLCELMMTAIPGGTRIEARVRPQGTMTGSYVLKVRDSGRAGSASIDQSGDFSATRGETVVLGEVELSSPMPRLEATLSLSTGGRTLACPLRISPTRI